jgi:hypothetical protein
MEEQKKITLSESEIAYFVEILMHYQWIPDIRKVCRLLSGLIIGEDPKT